MFNSEIYIKRRNALKKSVASGLIFLPGNVEAPYNYPANTYHFKQDSNFLYFFGLNIPSIIGIIDCDSDTDYLFGNDFDLDDIIWMGPQPLLSELALKAGIHHTGSLNDFNSLISNAIEKGRKIHFVPPYRGETKIQIADLFKIKHSEIKQYVSIELVKAIVELRSIKEAVEIAEIEKAIETAYLMHTTSMKMARPGVIEQEIVGKIEGIAISGGGPVSFPIILSINGETLHNHSHSNILQSGQLMVTDAGCETAMGYCSDITRTIPVGGKFSQMQKEIYEIVIKANQQTAEISKPGILYRDVHLMAAKTIASGLKDIGLMKGNVDEAVSKGAHALFFPHGLGHMLGLDVHDMESLGENFVGYDSEIKRSEQFGLAFLRLGRKLQEGFVITDEPGIYFIPSLIDKWKKENKYTDFINYDQVEKYRNFGGIRIEDNLLITNDGCRILGSPIPKTVEEIEDTMKI